MCRQVISDHPDVAEVAVVGLRDAFKGQIPLGLVVLNASVTRPAQDVLREVVQRVRACIGPVAAFKDCLVVQRLPKTRSGKILRATLRAMANGDAFKAPATLEDPAALQEVHQLIASYHQRADSPKDVLL